MRHENIPPEMIGVVLAMKGVIWLAVGLSKLNEAREARPEEGTEFGIVVGSSEGDGGYVATIEYQFTMAEKRRLKWRCGSEPSLGQSVRLRPITGVAGEMQVTESETSFGEATLYLATGAVLIGAGCGFLIKK